jgi:hypothetical protein
VEDISHGAQTDHKQAELGLGVQTLIFSQGLLHWREGEPFKEPLDGLVFALDLDAEAGCLERQCFGEGGSELAKPKGIFFGCEDCGSSRSTGIGLEPIYLGCCVPVVIRESLVGSELQTSSLKAGKELLGAGNPAEGCYRPVFTAAEDWDFHFAMQAPDGALPSPGP